MVKFAAAGYVCVDYYPDFNNRYYITGNGVDVLFNLLDIKKGKDMEASIISAVSDDEYGKEAVKMFHERNIDCSHLEVILGGMTPRVPLHLVDNGYTELLYGGSCRIMSFQKKLWNISAAMI